MYIYIYMTFKIVCYREILICQESTNPEELLVLFIFKYLYTSALLNVCFKNSFFSFHAKIFAEEFYVIFLI